MSRIADIAAVGRRAFTRTVAWVAGFTFWRFVIFSLLVLIAANLVGDLFGNGARSRPLIAVHDNEASPDAAVPAAPLPPAEPAKQGDAGGKSEREQTANGEAPRDCVDDMRVDWSGVHMSSRCGKAGSAASQSVAPAGANDDTFTGSTAIDIDADDERVELADVALAALAVLWVAWFVGQARRKAEARAEQAEATAERAEANAEREALERQVAEARLQALRAQVEPHFLFNTLGAVEHLITTDPPRAGEMQHHLIAFLRGAMPRMRGEAVTLGEEMELCRNYLAIMKIRMEERLDYRIDLPAELSNAPFPPMMLQSVVENAIKHGLEPKAEGGSILISARAAAGRLRVAVADSGMGFGNLGTSGTGIGLNNIRERLSGLFGERAALVISPNAPTGAQVVIEVPYDDSHHR